MLRWIALGLLLGGCELDEVLDAGPLDAFVDAGPPSEVGGQWNLTGEGRLVDCDNPRFETENLRLSSTLSVSQMDGVLTLTNPPATPGRFVFEDGSVRENRVRFTTLEEVDDLQIVLRFDGRHDALTDAISGRFEGEGPAGCMSSGTFRITR